MKKKWTISSVLNVIKMVVLKAPEKEVVWRVLKAIEIIEKETK